jgi:poly(beta-D-mannuronate) lyase
LNIKSFLRYAGLCLFFALPLSSCLEAEKKIAGPPLLAPPYDISTPGNDADAPPMPRIPCKTIPGPPLKDLVISGVYKRDDPHRAEIDEQSREEYVGQTRSLYRYETKLIEMSNLYLRTGNASPAACVLDWLYEWAAADALLGELNAQGRYVRQWSLASLSSAYMQIKTYAGEEPVKDRIVRAWLQKLAESVMKGYEDLSGPQNRLNNHFYWAAWAVTNTGVALNNRKLYDWGIARAKYALLTQATADGTLPLEMARGRKALQYHIFALAPLVMISESAARNGDNLYGLRDGILHKLVENVFSGIRDPSPFENATGIKQDSINIISWGHFSWLVVYNSRFPNETIQDWLQKHSPVFSRRTGGDMNFLYEVK